MVSKKAIIELQRYLIVYHCLRGAYLSIKLGWSNRSGKEMAEHRGHEHRLGSKVPEFYFQFCHNSVALPWANYKIYVPQFTPLRNKDWVSSP